jgi:hypothetical protein
MRRTASPSRPCGRYAVGLRPSLDPDAYFDAPNQDWEAPKQAKANAATGLDRPRSFKNDLRKQSRIGRFLNGLAFAFGPVFGFYSLD